MSHSNNSGDSPDFEGLVQTAEALSTYADLLEQHGPNAPEVTAYFEGHKHLPEFQELAKESTRLEHQCQRRELTALPMMAPRPPHSPRYLVLGLMGLALVALLAVGVAQRLTDLTGTNSSLNVANTELKGANKQLADNTEELKEKTIALAANLEKLSGKWETLENKFKNEQSAKTKEMNNKVFVAWNALSLAYRISEIRGTMENPDIAQQLDMSQTAAEVEKLIADHPADFASQVKSSQDPQQAALTLRAFLNAGQRLDAGPQLTALIDQTKVIEATFPDLPEVHDQAKNVVLILQQRMQ